MTNDDLGPNRTAMLCQVNKFSDGSPLLNKPFIIIRDGFLFERKNLSEEKVREAERESNDIQRVFLFVKDARENGKWVSEKIVQSHFASIPNPMPLARAKRAVNLLTFQGYEGLTVKLVPNPDPDQKDRVLSIYEGDREL